MQIAWKTAIARWAEAKIALLCVEKTYLGD
jgi:hypothetical protein